MERRMAVGGGPRVFLPGRVGVLVREVRSNVKRISACIDAHSRRCCMCGAGATALSVRCAQRVDLVRGWIAEYDEMVALEWLLGLRDDVPAYQMEEWGLAARKEMPGVGA